MIGAFNISVASGALVLAKSSLLLALGYATARLLHRAPAAARHIAWLTAIVGVLLVPVFDRYTPLPVHVLPAAAVLSALPTFTPSALPAPTSPLVVPPVAAAHATQTSHATSIALPHLSLLQLLTTAWAVIAFILLLRLMFGVATVGRLVRRSRVLASADWMDALESARQQLAVPISPRLVMSAEVDMAFAFDALSPTIVLPMSASEWSPERRRSVLLHELAHIRRRDLIGHAVAGLACAINWFNPFIWIAARQLRVESELASDEIVLGAGVRPSVYAQHLLDMVTSVSRRAPNVALAMARPKEFEGRLVAILEPARRHGVVAPRQGMVVAGLLALSTISIGAIAPVPRRVASPPIASASVAPASTVASHTVLTPTTTAERTSTAAGRGPNAVALSRDVRRADIPLQSTIAMAPPSDASVTVDASARLSSAAVHMLLRYGTGAIMNPMILLLREADSIGLTGAQADSIATLNRTYSVQLNRLWHDVSGYYATHPEIPNERDLNNGAIANRQTAQLLISMLPALDRLLTPEQRALLSPMTARYLDVHAIEATLLNSPTGVFVPESELSGLFGRGRRGGSGG